MALFNPSEVSAVWYGDTAVQRVYIGDQLWWPTGPWVDHTPSLLDSTVEENAQYNLDYENNRLQLVGHEYILDQTVGSDGQPLPQVLSVLLWNALPHATRTAAPFTGPPWNFDPTWPDQPAPFTGSQPPASAFEINVVAALFGLIGARGVGQSEITVIGEIPDIQSGGEPQTAYEVDSENVGSRRLQVRHHGGRLVVGLYFENAVGLSSGGESFWPLKDVTPGDKNTRVAVQFFASMGGPSRNQAYMHFVVSVDGELQKIFDVQFEYVLGETGTVSYGRNLDGSQPLEGGLACRVSWLGPSFDYDNQNSLVKQDIWVTRVSDPVKEPNVFKCETPLRIAAPALVESASASPVSSPVPEAPPPPEYVNITDEYTSLTDGRPDYAIGELGYAFDQDPMTSANAWSASWQSATAHYDSRSVYKISVTTPAGGGGLVVRANGQTVLLSVAGETVEWIAPPGFELNTLSIGDRTGNRTKFSLEILAAHYVTNNYVEEGYTE